MNVKAFLSALMILLTSFITKEYAREQTIYQSKQKALTWHCLRPDYFPVLNTYSSREEWEKVNWLVEDFVKQWKLKGAALALVKDGRLVYVKGFGYADQEKNIRVKPQHLFRIASVSKLFTAVGVMKLVEQDKLRLDDPVFGPEGILSDTIFQEIADPLALKIKVKHLLNHTGGWRNELRTDPMFVPTRVAEKMDVASPPSLETSIRFMLSQKGYFEPGTFYDYSNFGYALLGKVIEKVTGKSYVGYMQEEILAPLGIHHMQMTADQYEKKHPLEVRYYTAENAELNLSFLGTGDSASRAYKGTYTSGLGGAGGWIASPIDLMRFLVAIDGLDTKPDLLRKESIQTMTSPPEVDSLGKLVLGWKKVDQEKWWRTGSLACTGISLVRREDGLSWVFVTNTGTWRGPFFSYEIESLMRRVLAQIKTWPEIDLFELIP